MSESKETQNPLLTNIYSYLKGDEDLQELTENPNRPVGEDWLHLELASKDASFPYLVHRIVNDYTGLILVANATYWLDIWDYNTTRTKILAIRGRIIALLDQKNLPVTITENGEEVKKICNARFYIAADEPIPEETEGILRRTMRFDVRYDRKVEIEQILERSD